MRLKDKVVIITGAAGGMGREIVKQFLEEGAKIVAADLRFPHEIVDNEKIIIYVETDITNQRQVETLVERAMKHFGRIDVVLNAAGIAQSATPIEEVSNETWEKIFAINTTSCFLISRAVVPIMKKQGDGAFINIASISALRPRPGLNAYVASKGATIAYSQALAIELAENNIRVNIINPGPSETSMLVKFVAEGVDKEQAKNSTFKNSVPLGELIQPIDIANAAIYLSSDESRMVTGAVFNIDGGRGL
ncbi:MULTISPECIES: glucose 1-dehydrogenase [Bacillus]|uniref:glucose 1-dehydrogenase n=1 Tax=Bacillus TaxID=1386 RepID=UPI0002FA5F3C|nr:MULTISPECIES: glucose 1-dehydrogenase [Bacillus]